MECVFCVFVFVRGRVEVVDWGGWKWRIGEGFVFGLGL